MTVYEKVQKALEKIRPYIQMDGGDISLVGVNEETGIVSVSLRGACQGCPSAAATLKNSVERVVKAEVPEISEVRAVF
jgi:Fe-S cluster biogenesis protein NfuA